MLLLALLVKEKELKNVGENGLVYIKLALIVKVFKCLIILKLKIKKNLLCLNGLNLILIFIKFDCFKS